MSDTYGAGTEPDLDDEDADASALSDDALLERIQADLKAARDAHAEWRRDAIECFDFVAGRQWSDEDESQLRDEGRPPVVFNRTEPVIEAVAGSQVNNRQDIRFYPRGYEDDRAGETATRLAQWAREQCEAEDEESDAFREAAICGLGWTETRFDYDSDPDGAVIIERVDPLEMLWDHGARKKNLADAKWLARERPWTLRDIKQQWPDKADEIEGTWDGSRRDGQSLPVHRHARQDYGDTPHRDRPDDGKITVTEYQWQERVPGQMVADPTTGKREFLTTEEWGKASPRYAALGMPAPESVEHHRVVWRRAFICGSVLLERGDSPCPFDTTFTAITGKRDRNKGSWYGLVRAMIDPQRWSNKWLVQGMHIANSMAKGGLLVEEGAVADPRKLEEDWARPGAVVWVPPGTLSNGGIKERNLPVFPPAMQTMLQMANMAFPEVTGVNKEALGLVDRAQAGVLEAHRKQAAQAILAPLFDALRRYYKRAGRKVLHFIREYVPQDRAIRVLGEDGKPEFYRSAMLSDALSYDLVVDEAPSSPNAKQEAWGAIQMLLPIMGKLGVPMEVWLEVIKTSPLPASTVQRLQEIMQQKQQQAAKTPPPPDPAMVQAQAKVQATMQGTQARIAGDQQKAQSEAEIAVFKAQNEARLDEAKAAHKMQMDEMKAENDRLAAFLQKTYENTDGGTVRLQ